MKAKQARGLCTGVRIVAASTIAFRGEDNSEVPIGTEGVVVTVTDNGHGIYVDFPKELGGRWHVTASEIELAPEPHLDKEHLITDLEDLRNRLILAYEPDEYIRVTYVPQLNKLLDALRQEADHG